MSFALRNRPGVSKATRERILSVARDCGYKLNPFVTALMTHRRAAKRQSIRAIMGIISEAPLESAKAYSHSTAREFLRGAKERAADLGYHLEQFLLPDLRKNPRGIRRAFHTRCMNGLILHLHDDIPSWLDLDWENFAVISLGRPSAKPAFDFVSTDHFADMRLALSQLQRLGYRRIAFPTLRSWVGMHDSRYTSAFVGWHLGRRGIPPLVVPDDEWSPETIIPWIRKHRPDAVVSQDNLLLGWLRDAGYDPPADIGFAHLDLDVGWKSAIAGILQRNREVGAAAVNIVAGHINRSDFGIPATPHASLVSGLWVPGKTVRKVAAG